jgi:hypothetical protein
MALAYYGRRQAANGARVIPSLSMRRALAASLALTLTAAGASARANMAAIQRDPARLGAPGTTGPNPLRVEHEKLTLTCSDSRGQPVCAFEARYTVSNPHRTRHEVAAAFLGVHTRGVTIAIDGRAPTEQPSAAEIRAIVAEAEKAADEAPHVGVRGQRNAEVDRWGFVLVTQPGARHEIVVRGEILPGRRFIPSGYTMPAVQARHLLFGSRTPEKSVFDLEYLVAPLRTWRGDPRIDVRIVYPSRWRLSIAGDRGWSTASAGSSKVVTARLASHEAPPVLDLEIEERAPLLTPGGVLVGIGGSFAPGGPRPRGRIGYEIAAPRWLLYSLTADTNFRDRFIVTPMVEAASPAIIVVPSAGLGIGAPIQISPDPRAGVRFQADAHFYPVGIVTSVDVYPRVGALRGFTEVSVLAQIGL